MWLLLDHHGTHACIRDHGNSASRLAHTCMHAHACVCCVGHRAYGSQGRVAYCRLPYVPEEKENDVQIDQTLLAKQCAKGVGYGPLLPWQIMTNRTCWCQMQSAPRDLVHPHTA